MTRASGGTLGNRSWLNGVAAIALLQMFLGLAGLAAAVAGFERPRLAPSEIPDVFRLIAVLSLGSLAAYLLLGGRRDQRVSRLGTLFLLMGVFYASPAIESFALALPGPGATVVRLLGAIRIDALTPAVAWLFFRDFPRALEWPRTARIVSWVIRICVLVAILLIAVNLAIAIGTNWAALSHFDRANPASGYWTLVFGLTLPAPAFIVWRVRHAPAEERRRVRLFTTGLAMGAVPPILLALLPTFSLSIEHWARQGQSGIRAAQALMLASLVWIAANTTYAVAVKRVLEVGVVVRKAAQYALAWSITGATAALPFVAIGALLYRLREEPMTSLLEGPRPLLVGGLLAIGVGLLRIRRAGMDVIDRAFFRESHDARRILADVAERSGSAGSLSTLASSLTAEIDRALHLEALALLVLDSERRGFVPLTGSVRLLPATSSLAALLATTNRPLPIDMDRRTSSLRELPEADRQWLADAAVEVAVPLTGSAGVLIGLLTLGAKRSELPFSKEDLLLLAAIGRAAGLTLENRLLRDSATRQHGGETQDAAAAECARCGWLGAPGRGHCPKCAAPVGSASVPYELAGKFRVEHRLGAGAMGVVYRATDLTLGRRVALKTLPATSPEDSMRLRREARAMAAITHPNLALVFGAETWRGTPVLVMEYLAGGTLADRLAGGPLGPAAALQLSTTLANVLERLHASGILHRDVKPSNIGFTDQRVPKLLDFGLVRIAAETAALAGIGVAAESLESRRDSGLVGTPLYMSPEALMGVPPDPTFDLWSLSVVAFEALAGRHPFERETLAETVAAICEGHMVELPAHSGLQVIKELFATLLAPEGRRRPSTARKLAQLLRNAELQVSHADLSIPSPG